MDSGRAVVRLARSADAPILAAMSRDLIERGLGWQYRPRRVAQLIADPDTICVVIGGSRLILGFGIMSLGAESAHLILLAVQAAHQRQGLARHLMEWLLESAIVGGVETVHVELRMANVDAQAFYRSMGFKRTDSAPGYYRGRESAVMMVRHLRSPDMSPLRWMPPTLDKRT